jgi:hypothetical protein
VTLRAAIDAQLRDRLATSTRSRTPSPSSKHSFEKPPSEPSIGLWNKNRRAAPSLLPECAHYFAAAGYDAT